MNLDTTLTAQIGWTPDKTTAPLGPVVTCKICYLPRSVTVMGSSNICGPCDKGACTCPTPEAHEAQCKANITASDAATTLKLWVECSVRSCRAQYVLYNSQNLNVRPKCHYCRIPGAKKNDNQRLALHSSKPLLQLPRSNARGVSAASSIRTSIAPRPFPCRLTSVPPASPIKRRSSQSIRPPAH